MKYSHTDSLLLLRRTPLVLQALLGDLPDGWTRTNEGGKSWSAFDVVGHLIHGERTDWIPRAQIILGDRTYKTFEPFDRFAQFESSRGKSLQQLLDEFAELRTQNLQTLEGWGISEATLERSGVHPDFGPVTLRQLLATWVVHDLNHLHQIARVLAGNYREEVGPWRAYLSVLG